MAVFTVSRPEAYLTGHGRALATNDPRRTQGDGKVRQSVFARVGPRAYRSGAEPIVPEIPISRSVQRWKAPHGADNDSDGHLSEAEIGGRRPGTGRFEASLVEHLRFSGGSWPAGQQFHGRRLSVCPVFLCR